MKRATPVEVAQNTNFSTTPHEVGSFRPLFQVFIPRYAAVAYAIAFIVATGFVAYVERRIAMRQFGRPP